jgi:hypothetical protein
VPTFERTETFDRDYDRLSQLEREQFRVAIRKFVEDLKGGSFRQSLRVRGVKGHPRVFEMSWAQPNGRATFQYGPELRPGEPHVIWRRVGGHDISPIPS